MRSDRRASLDLSLVLALTLDVCKTIILKFIHRIYSSMPIAIWKGMIITASLMMVILLVFKLRRIVHKLLFSLVVNGGRAWLSMLRLIVLNVLMILPKFVLSHHEVVFLLLVLQRCSKIKELFLLIISLGCDLLVKERLVKCLSIVSLCSVKSIRNRRLFLIDEVDLISSLRSSHWRVRLNVSLFKCACCLDRRIRCRDPKVTVHSFLIEIGSCSSLLIRHILRVWEIFFARDYIVGRILLLKLLFWLIIVLVACILVLHYYWSFRWLRRGIPSRRPISSTMKEFRRITFSGLISDVWYPWFILSVQRSFILYSLWLRLNWVSSQVCWNQIFLIYLDFDLRRLASNWCFNVPSCALSLNDVWSSLFIHDRGCFLSYLLIILQWLTEIFHQLLLLHFIISFSLCCLLNHLLN